jgi:hypothetical protein
VGEDGESLTTSSIHIKGHPKNDVAGSTLLYKKEKKKRESYNKEKKWG